MEVRLSNGQNAASIATATDNPRTSGNARGRDGNCFAGALESLLGTAGTQVYRAVVQEQTQLGASPAKLGDATPSSADALPNLVEASQPAPTVVWTGTRSTARSLEIGTSGNAPVADSNTVLGASMEPPRPLGSGIAVEAVQPATEEDALAQAQRGPLSPSATETPEMKRFMEALDRNAIPSTANLRAIGQGWGYQLSDNDYAGVASRASPVALGETNQNAVSSQRNMDGEVDLATMYAIGEKIHSTKLSSDREIAALFKDAGYFSDKTLWDSARSYADAYAPYVAPANASSTVMLFDQAPISREVPMTYTNEEVAGLLEHKRASTQDQMDAVMVRYGLTSSQIVAGQNIRDAASDSRNPLYQGVWTGLESLKRREIIDSGSTLG